MAKVTRSSINVNLLPCNRRTTDLLIIDFFFILTTKLYAQLIFVQDYLFMTPQTSVYSHKHLFVTKYYFFRNQDMKI